MLKFIKAQFPNGRMHYDFICDIEDIKKGGESICVIMKEIFRLIIQYSEV